MRSVTSDICIVHTGTCNIHTLSIYTHAFEELLSMPSDVSEESMSLLEHFVVLMYDRTSDTMEVNDARKQLFAHKSRTLENHPPM